LKENLAGQANTMHGENNKLCKADYPNTNTTVSAKHQAELSDLRNKVAVSKLSA